MFRPGILFILILISSCSVSSGDPGTVEQILRPEKGGDFRGNDMGDDVQEVIAREEMNVIYNMPDEITCRIPLDMADSTFYEVDYSFDEGKLNYIELNLFPVDSIALKRLMIRFSNYYDGLYRPIENSAPGTWRKRSSRGKDVRVRMYDRSQQMQRPCLGISFLEEK